VIGLNQNNQSNKSADRNQLTDKELHYVKDFLSWELLAMKKYNQASMSCSDTQIKNNLNQMGLKHQQHYEALLTQLQS
jgi:hypothetical protein